MGTRNLTCVFSDGKYKIAQYGQWDGNPSGQGLTALKFLRKTDIAEFKKKLVNCRFATEEEIEARWTKVGAPPGADGVSMEIAEKFKQEYPQLSRDTGADVLDIVMKSEGEVLLGDHINFANDSLFCEWAYVIDLDKGTFEVFKGFNKKPLGPRARFADAANLEPRGEYFPVKLLKKFKLDSLPTEKEFLQKCGD